MSCDRCNNALLRRIAILEREIHNLPSSDGVQFEPDFVFFAAKGWSAGADPARFFTDLQAAVTAAAAVGTESQPALVWVAPGTYGDFAVDFNLANFVFISPMQSTLNRAVTGLPESVNLLNSIHISCDNFKWTAVSGPLIRAKAGISGVVIDCNAILIDTTAATANAATFETSNCEFNGEVTMTGSPANNAEWHDVGSDSNYPVTLIDFNHALKDTVFVDEFTQRNTTNAVHTGSWSNVGAAYLVTTDTNAGANGAIAIVMQGGYVSGAVSIDSGTIIDAPSTEFSSTVTSPAGGCEMNRANQRFNITTTGGGATNAITYKDSPGGHALPYYNNPDLHAMPVLIPITDAGAGGTMPTITANDRSGFSVKDYVAGGRTFVVIVQLSNMV